MNNEFKQNESWNYYYEAGIKGWIYKALEKFAIANENIMTQELLDQIDTEMPPFEVYQNVTPEMIRDKKNLNITINTMKNEKKQENERSMKR